MQVEVESRDGGVLIGSLTFFCLRSGICERNGNQFLTGQTYKDNCNLWYDRPPAFLVVFFFTPFEYNLRIKPKTVSAFASRARSDLGFICIPDVPDNDTAETRQHIEGTTPKLSRYVLSLPDNRLLMPVRTCVPL